MALVTATELPYVGLRS